MAPPLLTLANIKLSFGGTPLLEGADLFIEERDRLCLVGRNGSGKSTLLKIAADLVEADDGERFIKPGVTVQYLEQEPDMSAFDNVMDYAQSGFHEGEADYRVSYLLEQLGLEGSQKPKDLSGGEMRRAALARVLAPEPDILMLDEPTNHLDVSTIEWLEGELRSMSSAIVLISHDRRFLTNLSKRTLWIDRGQTRIMKAGFGQFEDWREKVLEEEEVQRHKLDRKIVREEHWLTYGVTARRKRNQKRLGDLFDLRDKKKQMKAGQTKKFDSEKITATESERSGKLVIEAKNISKSYDDRPLIEGLSLKINRLDRIGLVGPNGSGKTTLIKILTGELEPDTGTVRLGAKLETVTLDQKRESLAADATLGEILTGDGGDQVSVGGQQRHVISYMKDFLFLPEQLRTPISALSGGERGRLMLARAFARPSNLLVLDEPTNDLDLETLDLLQELLGDYSGTVLLVSHDRDFLDRVVTSTLTVGEHGEWLNYAGGYSDMLEQRKQAQKEQKAATTSKSKQNKGSKSKGTVKGKLTYKDKFALENIPVQMEDVNSKMLELQTRLDDPELYAKDPDLFEKTVQALSDAQSRHDDLEEEWLRLEMMREEIEG